MANFIKWDKAEIIWSNNTFSWEDVQLIKKVRAAGDVTASGNIKAAGFDGPLTTTGITSTGPGVFTT